MSGRLISQKQMDDLRSRCRRHTLARKLLEEFGSNALDVYVLNAQEMTRLWLNLNTSNQARERDFEELVGALPNTVIDYTPPVLDSVVLTKLGKDLSRSGNFLGAYRVISREGKSLIVFGGYPGLRRHLTAPIYGINHPKVVRMGVGKSAANAMLRSGLLLTLIISPVVRTIEWLFIDEKATLELVLARISTDITKGIIATGIGYVGSAFVAAAFGSSVIAVAPIAAGIAVAVTITLTLNSIDEELALTQKLADSLADARKDWLITTGRIRWEFNYYFSTPEGALDFIRRFPGNRSW